MFLPTFNLNYIIFMLPAMALSLIVQLTMNARFSRWSKVQNQSGLTGVQVFQRITDRMGLYGLSLKGASGRLTDHYDPRNNTLSLSRDIAEGTSVAAMAITAHELGHAQQDQDNYLPMKIRSAIVPMVGIGTSLGWILILVGLVLNFSGLAWLGVLAFSAGTIFAIATLPVELNASRRARNMLQESGLIHSEEERRGVKKVLGAAAMTYVAAIATSVMQLLYFASMVGGRRRN